MSNISILKKVTYLEKQEIDTFVNNLSCKKVVTVGFLNQYGFNLISKFADVKTLFFDLDYLLRDGVGINLACKYHGIDSGVNLNGTDLIPIIVNKLSLYNREVKRFSYGTKAPWLENGANKLFQNREFYQLDGFQAEQCYLEHFLEYSSSTALNIIILAMGMPKQEKVAALLKANSSVSAIVICGGAILDFQANRYERAPLIFRKIGFEWLYRLFIEPKRMFFRYVVGIPVFFYNVIFNKV